MKPIPTLIVDDEPLARRGLRALLGEDSEVVVVGEAGDSNEARHRITALAPELVFLDITMPGDSGLEVARGLGPTGPLVVFVTAYSRFALEAFESEAVDYVVKPFDDARFFRALERVKCRLRGRRLELHRSELMTLLADPSGAVVAARAPGPEAPLLKRLVLRSTGRIRVIELEEVDWIAGAGNYVRLYRGDIADLHRASLSELESRLDPARFVRIHRSAIVHIDRVRDLHPLDRGDYRLTLRDGTRLKLSRSYRHHLPRLVGEA